MATALLGLTTSAQAAPLDYVLLADAHSATCIARYEGQTKAGRDVTLRFFALPKGRFVLQLAPAGLKRNAVSRRTVRFSFEDTLVIDTKAKMHKGAYQVDLRSGSGSSDLLVGLVNRARMETRFPDAPNDPLILFLEGVPQMIERLRHCQEGMAK
ncbi:MAG: hypothetical protein ACRBBS_18500 [Thalassovita sp.]